jgi:SAM-dependent methyltransferase
MEAKGFCQEPCASIGRFENVSHVWSAVPPKISVSLFAGKNPSCAYMTISRLKRNTMMNPLEERERREIVFWRDSEHECPASDSLANVINKMTDCGVFLDILQGYGTYFNSAKTVLELGGGQGWASCVVKKLYTHLRVTLTDISEYAIQSKHKWERIFEVDLDNAYACKSYEISESPSSIDVVFCYAAAHHFADLDRTITEISRVLRSGGHCFFFHEPTTIRLLHALAYKRVNKKRSVVPEDVIVYRKLIETARKNSLKAHVQFNPSLIKRGPLETVYYFILSKSGLLQRILPCTANFHFQKIYEKPGHSESAR